MVSVKGLCKIISLWFLFLVGTASSASAVRTQCEILLQANESMRGDAVLRMMLLDAAVNAPKPVRRVPEATAAAVSEFLERTSDFENLFIRTHFSRSNIPEIEIYRKGARSSENEFVSLTIMKNGQLFYWEDREDNFIIAESDWQALPAHAEVGYVGTARTPHVIRRFVSERWPRNSTDKKIVVTLGLDVLCENAATYHSSPEGLTQIITPNGILCRVPVFESSFLPKSNSSS